MLWLLFVPFWATLHLLGGVKLIWINLVDGFWVFGCLENGGFNEILGGRGAARGVGVAGPWWMEISKSLLSLL